MATRDLPVVAVTNFDLVRVLGGAKMVVADMGGNEMYLRLYTADELLQAADDAKRSLEADGLPPGPGMTRAQAIDLTTPIGGAR